MLPDVRAFADYPAEIWNAERYESYRATYRHGTGNKKHNRQQKKSLMKIAQFSLTIEMSCQGLCRPDSNCKSDSKQDKGKHDISGCNSLQIKVRCAPEVIFLQQVCIGSICNDNCSKGSYECSEKDTESDQALGIDPQRNEKAYNRTYQRADKTSDSKRAPP